MKIDYCLTFRRITGRSNESLESSGDNPSSERRSTVHNYPQRSLHPYYGDESDEGLVTIHSLILNDCFRSISIYRIVCHQLTRVYRIITIVCHMIVMIKMVGELIF